MTSISERLQAIREAIHQAERATGRQEGDVQLLAVSKTKTAAALREAWLAGQKCFGENYVQEALAKMAELDDLEIEWHFIGPIQSNKTRPIAEHFAWVHGIDRLKTAQRLNDARPAHLPPLNVCIEINVSGEGSKEGVLSDEALSLAKAIVGMPQLRLRGLMTIPAPTDNVDLQHQAFKMLHRLYDALNAQGLALDTLSMGMSADYPVAIAEGATMIRIGTAIFGARPAKESLDP
jgi:pyridoxal phosphate enzyme (YggS family)